VETSDGDIFGSREDGLVVELGRGVADYKLGEKTYAVGLDCRVGGWAGPECDSELGCGDSWEGRGKDYGSDWG